MRRQHPLAAHCGSPDPVTSSSGGLGGSSSKSRRRRQPRGLRAIERVDEAPDLDVAVAAAAEGLDADILRLLVPAILAVFLDPAMALIDTGTLLGGHCCSWGHHAFLGRSCFICTPDR